MQDQFEDQQPPLLLHIWSKCSEFNEIDLDKGSPPRVILKKLNSFIEYNEPILYQRPQTAEPEPSMKQVPCSCTKTHCLKMYCSCFHNNRLCGELCRCEECRNVNSDHDSRIKAVLHIKKKAHRNKKVPEEKLFSTGDVWGCNCKQSRCIKKYCECFIRGKKCTVECNCDVCENGKDEDLYKEIIQQNNKPRHNKRVRTSRT